MTTPQPNLQWLDEEFEVYRNVIANSLQQGLTFSEGATSAERDTKAAIATKLEQVELEARVDELQHVDRFTRYYPDGYEPIEAHDRIAELKARLSKEQE